LPEYAERVAMNYRHQIKGRYFLVLIFFLNLMALLPVVFLIKNPTPDERVVMAGIWAYMAVPTAGMGWCLWGRPAGAATGFRTSCIDGVDR
jgi:hypothetical protein